MLFYVRLLDVVELYFQPHWGAAGNLPSPSLRYRVSGTPSRHFYLWYGRVIWDTVNVVMRRFSTTHKSLILDYGCGCGRMARHININLYSYTGADTDRDAVNWCGKNLSRTDGIGKPQGRKAFLSTDSLHDINGIHGIHDIVLAVSVFSHIDFDAQANLLLSFHSMLKDKGIIILTVHGAVSAAHNFDDFAYEVYRDRGYAYKGSRFMRQYFSSSYHSKRYIEDNWLDIGFELLEYNEGGLNRWQDIVVLRKI